ncbi:hypothetical protein PHMEG_00034951 [Phytophthora megakarya]|uniref:Integrase catalytic domain-containing protein n=1 Tax=Phytophthora megakarya TaxID=4795 RepID=A0A225UPK2_9STRA|nr:hypothetical protein PHMEG_00034951 [Phytophthora megakarya]
MHEQNGVAERMIRTQSEQMRCFLLHLDLPQPLWAEALMTATYCVNVCVEWKSRIRSGIARHLHTLACVLLDVLH